MPFGLWSFPNKVRFRHSVALNSAEGGVCFECVELMDSFERPSLLLISEHELRALVVTCVIRCCSRHLCRASFLIGWTCKDIDVADDQYDFGVKFQYKVINHA